MHSDTFWHILTHSDTFWHILTHFDTFWHILTHSDTFWHILTHSDTFWHILTHSGTILNTDTTIPNIVHNLWWLIGIRQKSQHLIFFVTYKWVQKAKVLYYTWLERLARDKHCSLLGLLVNYEENGMLCNQHLGKLITFNRQFLFSVTFLFISDTI